MKTFLTLVFVFSISAAYAVENQGAEECERTLHSDERNTNEKLKESSETVKEIDSSSVQSK